MRLLQTVLYSRVHYSRLRSEMGVTSNCLRGQNVLKRNKKDGYRQQNVRQRQKLTSIIDYDVCMTFY